MKTFPNTNLQSHFGYDVWVPHGWRVLRPGETKEEGDFFSTLSARSKTSGITAWEETGEGGENAKVEHPNEYFGKLIYIRKVEIPAEPRPTCVYCGRVLNRPRASFDPEGLVQHRPDEDYFPTCPVHGAIGCPVRTTNDVYRE